MLAAATSFFSRTAISQSYNIGPPNDGRSSTPTPSGSSPSGTLPPPPASGRVGLWRVQGGTHRVTSKRVSVWTFDKRGEMEGIGPMSKDHVLEVMKAEVTAALANIDIELTTLSGCCIEQITPSIHPRSVISAFTMCFTDQTSCRDG